MHVTKVRAALDFAPAPSPLEKHDDAWIAADPLRARRGVPDRVRKAHAAASRGFHPHLLPAHWPVRKAAKEISAALVERLPAREPRAPTVLPPRIRWLPASHAS